MLIANFMYLVPEGSNATQRRANAVAFAQEWLPEQCAWWTLADSTQRAAKFIALGGNQRMDTAQGWIGLANITFSVSYSPTQADALLTIRIPRKRTPAEQATYLTAKHANDTATLNALAALCLAEGTDAKRFGTPPPVFTED
jgi:hypothetical protein